MSTEQKSTAAVLDDAVTAFIAREERIYGTKLSKRSITRDLLADNLEESTLSRWTNPGSHKNWMIPTSRIKNVADVLGEGGDRERLLNDLMTARLAELSVDEKNESVVMATWIAGLLAPSADEADLLKVFGQVVGEFPDRVLADKGRLSDVKDFFESKMEPLLSDFWAERAADKESETEVSAKTKSMLAAKTKPKAPRSEVLSQNRKQRDAKFGARYQSLMIIGDIQRRLGITPVKKVMTKVAKP